jgi:hypothetical protein
MAGSLSAKLAQGMAATGTRPAARGQARCRSDVPKTAYPSHRSLGGAAPFGGIVIIRLFL